MLSLYMCISINVIIIVIIITPGAYELPSEAYGMGANDITTVIIIIIISIIGRSNLGPSAGLSLLLSLLLLS